MSRQYQSAPGFRASFVKHLLVSPATLKTEMERWADLPSSAIRVGIGFHQYVLEPHLPIHIFDATKTFTSKAGKAFWEEHKGEAVVTSEEMETIKRMADALFREPKVRQIFDLCQKEKELFSEEFVDGTRVPTKACLDLYNKAIIADIKTTSDYAVHFKRTITSLHYDAQAAWYDHMAAKTIDGKNRDFFWIVVETFPPYGVKIFQAKPDTIENGYQKWQQALDLYARCMREDRWPSYDLDIIEAI